MSPRHSKGLAETLHAAFDWDAALHDVPSAQALVGDGGRVPFAGLQALLRHPYFHTRDRGRYAGRCFAIEVFFYAFYSVRRVLYAFYRVRSVL